MTMGIRPRLWGPSKSACGPILPAARGFQPGCIMPSPSLSCRFPHEFVEIHSLVLDLGVLEHPGDDVVLQHQTFDLGQALRLRINPFYHLIGLLVGLRSEEHTSEL